VLVTTTGRRRSVVLFVDGGPFGVASGPLPLLSFIVPTCSCGTSEFVDAPNLLIAASWLHGFCHYVPPLCTVPVSHTDGPNHMWCGGFRNENDPPPWRWGVVVTERDHALVGTNAVISSLTFDGT
jgi:hypothetical protein